MTVLPKPDYNVDKAVEALMKSVSEQDPMNPEEAAENRKLLRPQFQRQKDGFTTTGRTVLSVGKWGRYVETIAPSLSTGKSQTVAYLVKDDQTFSKPLTQDEAGHVAKGDMGNGLNNPADAIFLGGIPIPGKQISSKIVDGELHQYQDISVKAGSPIWIDLRLDQAGHYLLGGNLYMQSGGGDHRVLMATYVVKDADKQGRPERVEVLRYMGKRPKQRELYELEKVDQSKDWSYHDVLANGVKIVDSRLGSDTKYQVYYRLQDNLPSMVDLEKLQKAQVTGGGRGNQNWGTYAVVGAGLLLVGSGLALQIRRRRPHKST
ncbi:hypothetical protein [Fimbriimonas ginsengisoli]|uniref:hypothetical protein n=1 Tax=Fimbriimonas ginsengisoli TaxID=1005039 RepID=UPI001184F088|nr:hypothetical protein [Fimbriimonas ginsengisoli]